MLDEQAIRSWMVVPIDSDWQSRNAPSSKSKTITLCPSRRNFKHKVNGASHVRTGIHVGDTPTRL
jgi:hypothetical protein